jgi:hypothetical protein
MKVAPTSQMWKTCIVLIFKGRNYESILILKTRIQRRLKNKHVPTMRSKSKSHEVNMFLITVA